MYCFDEIETWEGLDALPCGTKIIDKDGLAWEKYYAGRGHNEPKFRSTTTWSYATPSTQLIRRAPLVAVWKP